jgi:hypothetical protein
MILDPKHCWRSSLYHSPIPEHQIAMQAPKDSKAYKNSINGVGKMVHRYSFTQVKPPKLSLRMTLL